MASSIEYELGTRTQMLSTELNSLANGSGVTQSTGTNAAFDNTAVGNLFPWARFDLLETPGSAPTADQTVDLYAVPAADGTNYTPTTDGASPIVDKNQYLGSFDMKANTSAQRPVFDAKIRPELFKLYAINNQGSAFPATASTVNMTPFRLKST